MSTPIYLTLDGTSSKPSREIEFMYVCMMSKWFISRNQRRINKSVTKNTEISAMIYTFCRLKITNLTSFPGKNVSASCKYKNMHEQELMLIKN